MLKLLDYSVEFPTTGRCFQNRIEFAPGVTAITGRNEAGKTIILEMIGYCLFGKSALRGLASDYRNLTANLELMIGDKEVAIARAPRSETLFVNGQQEAVGAEAINAAVPKLLGFGLDVFNIACASQQGDLGKLTEMRPTARRQMVDQLIGLDLLEGIEKECKAEAKTQDTLATGLMVSMPIPQEPVKPDDYEVSLVLEQQVKELQAHEAERAQLLRLVEPTAPVEPVAPEETDVAMLEAHEANRQILLQTQARLQGQLAGIPVARYSREELERAHATFDRAQEINRRGPKPDYTAFELEGFQSFWTLQRQYEGHDTISCPKCEHEFVQGMADEDLARLRSMDEPPISEREITTQFRRIELWADPLPEIEEFHIDGLQEETLAHAKADERAALVAELDGLTIPVDRGDELRAARAYQSELAVYGERAARYSVELDRFTAGQARLRELGDKSVDLANLQRRLGEARAYEAAHGRYLDAAAAYDALAARARSARDLADGFGRGADSLKAARAKVKQELAPSLSQAASTLIAAMTGGERRHVDVDHDFNIVVDGQPLQTLSGSGKSVVNLALRIGLGQVLTSKVLPIFMGDEIDADLDGLRVDGMHKTLHSLKNFLTQVIIVTHKQGVDADNHINLSA